ncbi:MAG: hypothetical protein GY845_21165 [Planctomycetes bacterium]|nr:hypothetical protein [Planctomycetota bacterium]
MNKPNSTIRYFLFSLIIINALTLLAKANSSSESGTASKRIFRAGAAVSNITPPLDEPVIGGWNSPPATHVHDELYAKCLVLDDGKTSLVFVVCDNLGISREVYDKAKRIMNKKTSIPIENMMMSATHTHSSITARSTNRLRRDKELSSYQQFLVSRISDGVRRAINNLKPARIGWGCAQEQTQVFNRRWYMKPGVPVPNPFGGEDKVVMNPGRGNPNILKAAGPTDPQIPFISVQSVDGRTIALLANYSLHYVGGGQRGVISADYFGIFADKIRQLLGADRKVPPFVGILTNGTSGDINNIDWLNKTQKRYAPYEKMQQVADLVAGAVYEEHKKLKFRNWAKLDAMQNELTLAVRKPTDKQIAYAQRILKKPDDTKPYHRHEKVYARRTLQMQDTPAEVSVVLQTFRIGDLGICAIPFEVFVEIGLEMKAKSPFEQTFTISHANGTYGYLPTVAQHKLGGYETWLGTNMVEFQASAKIVRMLSSMFNRMK